MTIVLTGGGSGGHITPLLAVASELKHRDPKLKLIYIGQRGDGLGDIPAADPNIDHCYTIRAGKFRRYHGEGWRQLLDLPTIFLNLRDVFYVLAGLWQSRRLLKRLRPDVIFIKGGFVGVPVGLAAASLHLPYITHDSDILPGLANRIIARWAAVHAVALPKEVYSYPAERTVTTGIPLQTGFVPVTEELKKQYRGELNLPFEAPVLFIVGGGLGSQRVNRAVGEAVPHLLHEFPKLHVLHVVGRGNQSGMEALYQQNLAAGEQGRVTVKDYVSDVFRYSGAADVVVTRAGATNLAEFAVQGRACVIIPSPFLTGGHQLKNAAYLAEQQAAVVIQEDELAADPNRLAKRLSELFKQPKQRDELGQRLASFAQPDARRKLAELILEQAAPKA